MRTFLRRLRTVADAYTLATLNPAKPGKVRPDGGTGPDDPNRIPARRRADLRADRRAEQRERRRIAAELAEYRTPAERAELDMILGRQTEDQIRELEDLLPPRPAL